MSIKLYVVIVRLDRAIQSRKLLELKTLDSRLRENDDIFIGIVLYTQTLNSKRAEHLLSIVQVVPCYENNLNSRKVTNAPMRLPRITSQTVWALVITLL